MLFITECQYFPTVDTFKMSIQNTHLMLEQYELYRKTSFRNRCVILGGNGLLSLTVPLIGGREQRVHIRDVQIDYSQSWARTHIRSMISAYNKAPFFNYYLSDLETILNKREKFLFDLNYQIIDYIIKVLKIKTFILLTEDYKFDYPAGNGWLLIRKQIWRLVPEKLVVV